MNRENLGLGLAVCTIVPAIFQACLPPVATVRESTDDAGHLASGEKSAALTAGIFVLAVAAVSQSAEVAGLGLAAVFAFSAMYATARNTPA